jgi:hypothetical protein
MVCCRDGELLLAKAALQQNIKIEAITVRSCGIFELIARLSLVTRGITRNLYLLRSINRVKLDDAGTETRTRKLKQRAMTDDCFSMSRFANLRLTSFIPLKTRIYDARDECVSEWRQPWANDSLIKLQRDRISCRAVGVGAAGGVTITVAVRPAASVIVGGTLSILIRTGMRWASRTHV